MYIGGLKNGSLRADVMPNLQMGKYLSIIASHNDAAKNSLWRCTSAITLRTVNNGGDRKRKGATFTPVKKKKLMIAVAVLATMQKRFIQCNK